MANKGNGGGSNKGNPLLQPPKGTVKVNPKKGK